MCGKKVKHKVFVSDKTYKKKDIKKFVWYFPSGNVILVPVNQRICKNCINLKKKKLLFKRHTGKPWCNILQKKLFHERVISRSFMIKLKIFQKYSEKKPTWNRDSNFLPSFLSDNNILIPVNQQICKFLKCQRKPIRLFRWRYIEKKQHEFKTLQLKTSFSFQIAPITKRT